MTKLVILVVTVWLVFFSLRIITIGGIDPLYRDSQNELLISFRTSLDEKIQEIVPYPQSTLLSGILLGNNSIPFFLKQKLQTTGTIHMVVVSGQNLSLVAGFLMGVVYLVGRRQTICLIFVAIIIYALLTGLGVPVIRAGVMVSLVFLAQLFGRESRGWWILTLTGAAMLLYQPNWISSISFQLSFLATFGVVVVSPIIASRINFVTSVIRNDLAVTLAAQLMTMPIIAANFNQLSLIALLANLLTLWTIPFIMVSGLVAITLGFIDSFLGTVAGLAPTILLTYYIYIIDLFAQFPLAVIQLGDLGWIFWIGYYLLLISGLIALNKKTQNQPERILY